MPQQRAVAVLFALLAAAAAAVFFAISLDHEVYAPGARAIDARVARHPGVERLAEALPARVRRHFDLASALRKLYSVIAFGIVGTLAAPLVARPSRIAGIALLVAGFSAAIEVAQWLTGVREGLASNAFDVLCGAVGGALGGALWNAVSRNDATSERRR